MPQAEARVDLDIAARAASGAETSTSSDSSSGSPTSSPSSPSLFPPPPSSSPLPSPSSTFTVSPLGASLAGIAVAAGACALAAGGHWRATASALAEEGIDAVTRRKAVPTAVRKVFFSFSFLPFFLSLSLPSIHLLFSPLLLLNSAPTGPRPGRRHGGLRCRHRPRRGRRERSRLFTAALRRNFRRDARGGGRGRGKSPRRGQGLDARYDPRGGGEEMRKEALCNNTTINGGIEKNPRKEKEREREREKERRGT